MKISLITFGATGGSSGGIEQYSANLIDAFLYNKKIKLIYVFSKAPLKLNKKKIRVFSPAFPNSRFNFFVTIMLNIINIMRSEIIILSHINHVPFLIIPILFNKKVVLLSYGGEIFWHEKNFIYKFLLKRINFFICMRYYTMKALKKKYDLRDKKFFLLPNGIKLKKIRKLKKNKNIITVARLWSIEKYKGIDETLEALSLLKKMNFYYFIVGDGEDKERLIQKAEKLNIIKNVKFLGKVSNKMRDKLYLNSSIISMPGGSVKQPKENIPYDTYPFRFTFLEAANFGLKILGSTPQNTEKYYEKKYKNLYFANPRNRKQILDKILKLQKQKRQIDKRYLKDFSFDNFKIKLNNILSDIAK